MIKLISQFDNEKMRVSVATPTCGCCSSCCCCCIVSTITTSIITSRNFGKVVEEEYEYKDESYEEVRSKKIEAYLLGALLIPLVVASIILYFLADVNKAVSFLLGISYLIWLITFIQKHEGFRIRIILVTILTIIVFLALAYAEIFIWITFIFN